MWRPRRSTWISGELGDDKCRWLGCDRWLRCVVLCCVVLCCVGLCCVVLSIVFVDNTVVLSIVSHKYTVPV